MNRTLLALGCFAVVALAVPAAATDSLPSGTPSGGGACKVTGGPNAGKSGVYANDVDGLNCSGSWGATACTDGGKDNGKCKAAMTVHRPTNTMMAPQKPASSTY